MRANREIVGVAAVAAMLSVCLLGDVSRAAQDAPGAVDSAKFEVVSVKPNSGGPGPTMMRIQAGGRFTATNVTVRNLITNAYRMQPFQIVGGPSWLTSDHFDVIAKAPSELADPFAGEQTLQGPTQLQLMLRAMLADRFNLKVHTESREQPIYALVLARSDAKLGAKLTRSTTDCRALMAAGRGRAGEPPQMPAFGQPMVCGMRIGPGSFSAGSVTLAQVASSLSNLVTRTVIDRTGLEGNFDLDLAYTPDQMPSRAPGTAPDQPILANGIAIDPNGPSIFTAIQEQLGLKLESTKGPVDVLVIDSVDHPTED